MTNVKSDCLRNCGFGALSLFLVLPISCNKAAAPPAVGLQPAQLEASCSRTCRRNIGRDWKASKTVTLDFTDAPLAEVMKELERQSGVKVSCFWENRKLTLKLTDVPLWQALAETSIRANLPIWVFGKRIEFDGIADYVYRRYQIVGPFFVGLHFAPDLLGVKDGKKMPGLTIACECLPSDGAVRFPGIAGAVLEAYREKNPVPLGIDQQLGQSPVTTGLCVIACGTLPR